MGQGFQDVDEANKTGDNKFKKFLRIYMMRNRINIDAVQNLIEE